MELDGADEVVFSIGPHGVHVIVLLKLDAAIVNVHERVSHRPPRRMGGFAWLTLVTPLM
jgi:hypothetical protein